MNQTTLSEYDQRILERLQDYNYCNSGIICDVVIADKLKEVRREKWNLH